MNNIPDQFVIHEGERKYPNEPPPPHPNPPVNTAQLNFKKLP